MTAWSFTSGKANHRYATFSLLIQRIDLNYPVPIRRLEEVQLVRVQVKAVARWVVVPVSVQVEVVVQLVRVQVEIAVQVREEVRLALSAVVVPVAEAPVRLAGQVVAALRARRPEPRCW